MTDTAGGDASFWQPVQVGGIALKHRVIMSPLTRDRATIDLVPTDRDAETSMLLYYEQRATPGELRGESLMCVAELLLHK